MVSFSAKPLSHLYTQTDLVEALKRLGLKAGDVLEVHASLKSIGYIVGAANALLEAFLTVLTPEGTLVMAAQAHDNSEPAYFSRPPLALDLYERHRLAHPPFQGKYEDVSRMGALAMAMQKRPNVYFSKHPQAAFMAMGKQAKWITQEHPLEAMFGPTSPLGKLRELKAKVLLIGVDYDACTAMHLGEHLSGVRPLGLQGARVETEKGSQWVKFVTYHYDSELFKSIGASMEVNQIVELGQLGQASTKLMQMDTLTRFTKRYFEDL